MFKERSRFPQWNLFAGIWVLSLIADKAKRGDIEDGLNLLLIGVIAILSLRPHSKNRLLVVAILQSAWFLQQYQEQTLVHWYIAFVFHTALFIVVGTSVFESLLKSRLNLQECHWSFENLARDAGAIARFLSVAGIAFAGLAKLNADFFDPTMGCGSVYFLWVRESPLLKGWFPSDLWAQQFAIYFTCVAELFGPLLILIPRTRKYGLLLTWTIMFTLGMNLRSHYFEFSGLFIAMSMFWLPHTVAERVLEDLGALASRICHSLPKTIVQEPCRSIWQLLILEVILGFMLSTHFKPWRTFLLESYRYAWLSLVGALLGLTLWHLLRWNCDSNQVPVPTTSIQPTDDTPSHDTLTHKPLAHSIRTPRILIWIVPLLFLANELTPYLGLGHLPTMTMASNGQFRPGYTNHFLIPRPLTIPWSRDIEVTRTNRAANEAGIKKRRHMAWIDLVDRIRQHPKARVEYRIAGQSEVLVAKRSKGPGFARDSWHSRLSWVARVLRLSPYRYSDSPRACGKAPPGIRPKKWERLVKQRIEERRRSTNTP